VGARRRPPRERAATGRPRASAWAGPPAPARRPARLLEGEGPSGRPSTDRHLGRRPARQGDHRVLPRARHPHPRGVRPHRVHNRGDGQPAVAVPLRHGRPGTPRRRAPHRR
jgi:hypothetical protein